MSKFQPLWEYIKEKDLDFYQMSFEEIQTILGFDLDHSFLSYKKELKEYGYEIDKILLKQRIVMIKKLDYNL